MSLTQKIKTLSAREYQAKDGTIYLLQRAVNMNTLIAAEGLLPDIISAQDSAKGGQAEEMLKQNPGLVTKLMSLEEKHRPRVLRQGLIGEVVLIDGQRRELFYTMVDKPAAMLQEGEVNPELIPEELAQELFQAISQIGVPEVAPAQLKTFPVQPAGVAGSGDGDLLRQAAQRGDLGS